MRLVLGGLCLVAIVLGAAGVASLLVVRRLDSLAPGGLTAASFRYRPFSGDLRLDQVTARDRDGQVVLTAERLTARVGVLDVLTGGFRLRRLHVVAPRLLLTGASPLALVIQAAGVMRVGVPIALEGLVVDDGTIVIRETPDTPPTVVRDVHIRANHLTATLDGDGLPTFLLQMRAYGSAVQLAGQPLVGGSYGLQLRARGVDLAALSRDFPLVDGLTVREGAADVVGDLRLQAGRLLVSGQARVSPVALVGAAGHVFQAQAVSIALDRYDVRALTGRISRLDLTAPVLVLRTPAGGAPPWLAALPDVASVARGLVLRRLIVNDGELHLIDPELAVGLRRLRVLAHSRERDAGGAFVVRAEAAVGRAGRVSVDGVMGRGFRHLDADVRAERVDVTSWRRITGGALSGLVSFDGRIRLDTDGGEARAFASGQAVLADVQVGGDTRAGGLLGAEAMRLSLRRFEWPSRHAVVDAMTVTGGVLPIGALAGPRARVVRNFHVDLLADMPARSTRLRLTGDVGAFERWYPADVADPGLPLSLVVRAVEEALAAAEGAALPRLP